MTLTQADFRAAIYPGGDHILLLGEVMTVECQIPVLANEPLLYYNATVRAIR